MSNRGDSGGRVDGTVDWPVDRRMDAPSSPPDGIRLRRPVESDHPRAVAVVDDWWGGRRLHELMPRLWFQHFTGTSWIAETQDGGLAGFLVGFISPDHADEAYIHMVATSPNLRKRGLGRALYEAFFADVSARGVTRVRAISWPGNRVSVGFHRAMGFTIVEGPETRPFHGTPAVRDYDYPDEERVRFVRELRR